MHRPTTAFVVAGLTTEQLCVHSGRIATFGEDVPVASVRAGDDIVGVESGAYPHRDGLLPQIFVYRACDRTFVHELSGAFLESPQELHTPIPSYVLLRRNVVSVFHAYRFCPKIARLSQPEGCPVPSEKLQLNRTRVAQLERDIAKAVNRLLVEFGHETGASPHAIDVELIQEGRGTEDQPLWVVSGARVHFEDTAA